MEPDGRMEGLLILAMKCLWLKEFNYSGRRDER